MKLISQLKEHTFEKHLKNDLVKINREPLPFNMEQVARVGLLYHYADDAADKLVNDFVSGLRENHLKVTVLGYFKERALPKSHLQKIDWNLLNPKNVNWYHKPVAPFFKSFCDEEFDLLIDLTMEDILPLIYAGALSKAHFKTGRYTERNAQFYDLLIHTEQVQSLSEFIQHVRNYISKVNR